MIKNLKSQISNLKSTNKGFTLVEILVVLGVILTVGGIAGAIIFSSLRISNKANNIENIRQNGNFAVSRMSRTILYAKSFNGVCSGDNCTHINDCTTPQGSPTPSPSTKYSSVKVTLFDGSEVTYSCSPSDSPTRLISTKNSEAIDLIDGDTASIASCHFTCSQLFKTNSPTIGINLILSQAGETQFAEKQASVSFTTSVTMRNPNK